MPLKAQRLDRFRSEVEMILTNNDSLSFWLCPHTYMIQYFKAVIAAIPKTYRFKVGITAEPFRRFYEKKYAYNKKYIKRKQGVQYEHMTILHISHSRSEIAAFEHGLIDWYNYFQPRRCANIKNDYDKNFQNEDTDSGDERADGPFFLYVVLGKPFPRW